MMDVKRYLQQFWWHLFAHRYCKLLCSYKNSYARVPDVSYSKLFLNRPFVPGVLKDGSTSVIRVRVGLVLRLGLGVSVRGEG